MIPRIALWLALLAALPIAAPPQPALAAEEGTVRAEVGKPLEDAKRLLAEKRYEAALERVRAAEQARNKTPYESFVIEEMRGAIASAAGDDATAIQAAEAMLATNRLGEAERRRLIADVAGLHYRAKDYPRAIAWLKRYAAEGGHDAPMRWLLVDAYYASGDCAAALHDATALLQEVETAGKLPSEDQLQLVASCQATLKDDAAYAATLEHLLRHYPKPDYWTALLRMTARQPGFAERLRLDLDRVTLAAGVMSSAADFTRMAELALVAGIPGEAQTVIAAGYHAGSLGTGPDSARHAKLRDYAARAAAEDQPTLDQRAAAPHDAAASVRLALDYLGYGAPDKAIPLLEATLAKGGLTHPDDARLELGIAYLKAGRKPAALAMLATVQGSDGTAALARFWSILAAEPG